MRIFLFGLVAGLALVFAQPSTMAMIEAEIETEAASIDSGVNIKGINKTVLLRKLWFQAPLAACYDSLEVMIALGEPAYDFDGAAAAVQGGYIDYYCGKRIKLDLSGDFVNPYAYDMYVGRGAFAKIVAGLRK